MFDRFRKGRAPKPPQAKGDWLSARTTHDAAGFSADNRTLWHQQRIENVPDKPTDYIARMRKKDEASGPS